MIKKFIIYFMTKKYLLVIILKINERMAKALKESEVLDRLGLKDGELEKILGFKVCYDEKHTIFRVLDDNRPVKKLKGSKTKGWRVRLNGDTESCEKSTSKLGLKNLRSNNPVKINGQYFFNHGHILASQFYSFINDKEKENIIKDNKRNGFIQFSVANLQQEEASDNFRKSQAFYENKIVNYLKNEGGKIQYEVTILFYDKDDKIPIGTKILFKTIKQSNSQKILENDEDSHIFIPNFDKDFDLPQNDDNANNVDSYREFYCKGYDDKYQKCFKNIAIPDEDGKVYDEAGHQVFYPSRCQ
ncbi:hypothetical protein [Streptococcus sp. sy010]|uniref:hypothetical protein n=1 Tax=Streptococcus sp. sy010 TaxID=2600148 RepID=UPI0011B52D3B|nr:hypothetical protein [Streptococcus sp. sy010]TWT14245.1 hypothetical protein FRX51_05220 [Streptococcus sp. sy010]